MVDKRVDTVVIGSGPGGYVAGIRLGQLGRDAVVVERAHVGGVCLNVGCIPSKALIHAAKTFEKICHAGELGIDVASAPTIDLAATQRWKTGIVTKLTRGVKQLLDANGTRLVRGTAMIEPPGRHAATDGHVVTVAKADGSRESLHARNIIVATGSHPIPIPGFEVDGHRVIDSSGALALDEVPRRLTVIGGGYIGLELGTVYAKLGAKVTVVEALDSILAGLDVDCAKMVARRLRKLGVEVVLGARATGWHEDGDQAVVTVATRGDEMRQIEADRILVTVGRRPSSAGLGLAEVGVRVDERGFVNVDDRQRTNVRGIYAIGDVTGGMMLAHKASKEAEVAAEVIAGLASQMDAKCIPAVVFTDPEIASVGMTQQAAAAAGHEVRVGTFPFAALGRALSVHDTTGFAKVVATADGGDILGVHVVGNGASDLISEAALAIEMGAVLHDVGLTIHPHPTLSEAIAEAAKAALGEAIHKVNR